MNDINVTIADANPISVSVLNANAINVSVADATSISVSVADASPISVSIADANPINVTVGGAIFRNWVIADQKFFFNGLNGDTYFVYVSASSQLQLFVNGSKK